MAVHLRSGELMEIRTVQPPLAPADIPHIGAWQKLRDELFAGQLQPVLDTTFFIGSIGEATVGSLGYCTPADTHDVGLVEFVQTDDRHRRKGIARALMQALIDEFESGGGQALYLCTRNPHAGTLYEQLGFEYLTGDGMRRITPSVTAFDDSYLGAHGTAIIRDASWADLPRAAVLYNHPEPRWMIKDPITHCYQNTRYERHFVDMRVELAATGGASLVLAAPEERLVGLSAFIPGHSFFDQHVATMGFRTAPAYVKQAGELLAATIARAETHGVRDLRIPIADGDDDQYNLLAQAGFTLLSRIADGLRDDQGWRDLLWMTCRTTHHMPPTRKQETFYAERDTWHHDRLAKSREIDPRAN